MAVTDTLTLLSRARTGNRDAADELFRRYAGAFLTAARGALGRGLRRKVESMDVVQEAMTRAFDRLPAFQPRHKSSFTHWISRIVRNIVRDMHDHFSALKRDYAAEVSLEEPSPGDDGLAERLPDAAPSLPDAWAAKEEGVRILRALAALSDDQRDVLSLRLFHDLPYEEVARRMGKSPDAVRRAYARAQARLAVRLRPEA